VGRFNKLGNTIPGFGCPILLNFGKVLGQKHWWGDTKFSTLLGFGTI